MFLLCLDIVCIDINGICAQRVKNALITTSNLSVATKSLSLYHICVHRNEKNVYNKIHFAIRPAIESKKCLLIFLYIIYMQYCALPEAEKQSIKQRCFQK